MGTALDDEHVWITTKRIGSMAFNDVEADKTDEEDYIWSVHPLPNGNR